MKKKKLDIIYEDKYLIVVNKDAGVLTISNGNIKENTLYREVSDYVKKQHKSNKIFIVHRLDKDTSGLVVFAKTEQIKHLLQENWHNTKRIYLGIVNGIIEPKKGQIKTYLKETKTHLVYSSKTGQLAITNYEKIASNKNFSLLKIDIATGRHHQIRVHLSEMGYPLLGDKIYNKLNSKNTKRLYLHAIYLEFCHPITKEVLKLATDYPPSFAKIIEHKKRSY